jgi:carboxyl-terminal processing protease
MILRGGASGGGVVTADEADFIRTLLEVKERVQTQYVREIESDTLRQAAITGMLATTTDRNTVFVPPAETQAFEERLSGIYYGIGVQIEAINGDDPGFRRDLPAGGLIVQTVFPGGPAREAGLQRGDLILGVNDTNLIDLTIDEARDLIKGERGTTVTLSIRRDGQPLEVDVRRDNIVQPMLSGISFGEADDPRFLIEADDLPGELGAVGSGELPRIALIRLREFTPTVSDRLRLLLDSLNARQPLDGLLLDLRGNPGGRLDEAVAIADLFLNDGRLITWDDGQARQVQAYYATAASADAAWIESLPMVVLVDGASASASEVVSGALHQHRRATLVGTPTFGKGSVQTIVPIGGGRLGQLKLTEAYYHLPDGRIVERTADRSTGVEVDVVVPATAEDPVQPDELGPIYPHQVWAAYELLVAELLIGDLAREDVVKPAVVEGSV